MSMILLIAAQGMALPALQPLRMNGLLSGYGRGSVGVELFLDPEGTVLECTALGDTVSEEAKARICEDAVGRRFYDGARGPDGQPVHGEASLSEISRADYEAGHLPAAFQRKTDFEVVVSAMPGIAERREVNLAVYIDEEGHVRQCQRADDSDVQFAAIACTQSAAHTFTIHHSLDGAAVPYVGVLRIDFVRE